MVRFFIFIMSLIFILFKTFERSRPIPDIKKWSFVDKLYAVLKIFRPVLKAEKGKGIEELFSGQILDFSPENDFKPEASVEISAGGDIMTSYGFDKRSLSGIWDDIGDFLLTSDVLFANLENPVDSSKPVKVIPKGDKLKDWIASHSPAINGSMECIETLLNDKQLLVLSTASNHCMNMGKSGLLATLDILDVRKIMHVGTSRTPQEQDSVPVIEKNGIKLAFLAYTFSLNEDSLPAGEEYLANFLLLNEPFTDISIIKKHIGIARSKGAEFIIASIHWGHDIEAYPVQNIINRGHELIEAGIDVIIGHHPHILQPLEKYTVTDPGTGNERTGLIAYSLSELLTFLHFLPLSWLSCILRLRISKGIQNGVIKTCITDVKMLPFYKKCHLDTSGNYSFYNINLRKALDDPDYYREKYALNENDKKNMTRLNKHLTRYVLPSDSNALLLEKG